MSDTLSSSSSSSSSNNNIDNNNNNNNNVYVDYLMDENNREVDKEADDFVTSHLQPFIDQIRAKKKDPDWNIRKNHLPVLRRFYQGFKLRHGFALNGDTGTGIPNTKKIKHTHTLYNIVCIHVYVYIFVLFYFFSLGKTMLMYETCEALLGGFKSSYKHLIVTTGSLASNSYTNPYLADSEEFAGGRIGKLFFYSGEDWTTQRQHDYNESTVVVISYDQLRQHYKHSSDYQKKKSSHVFVDEEEEEEEEEELCSSSSSSSSESESDHDNEDEDEMNVETRNDISSSSSS